MPLPINSVAQAFTEQQQRQADIGATQAGTLQRLMQVAIGNYELKNAQRQQEAQDQMRNFLMQQEMYQGAVGNPNTSDPNAKSLAASAQEESAVDRSVRELTAKSGYYDRALRQAMLLNDVNAVKELRVLSDNATTQLREARKEKMADEYKKIDYLGGLAYNAGSPDDVADFVREVARVQGPAAAAQLVQGGNGVPGLRADPQDPQRFLFGDPERAALSRYVARSTQAKEQAQMYHWRTTEEQAKAEFADRQARTASLIADRNSRIAARQHGVQLPGGTGNLEATPGAKVASINLVPGEGSPYTEADIRQMQNDIARDAGVGLPGLVGKAAAATGAVKNVEYIYPRKEDGSIDPSKGPIGTRGVTKEGKIVVLDAEGNPTTLEALGGGTEKERKATTISLQNATRNRLVQGAAKNAMRILTEEIEKKYPNDNTSILMQVHPEGLTETLMAGAIKSGLDKHQQNVDSTWRAFIDEAIPVFTGGLRGSDAFRRFLIAQAPTVGTKNQAEIRELFRKNIEGMDTAFANMAMSVYSSDPKYWGTRTWDNKPVTREDVEASKAWVESGRPGVGGGGQSSVMQKADEILKGK